jgi:hypothetical protein
MQRYRRYRGISGLIETTVNRSLVTLNGPRAALRGEMALAGSGDSRTSSGSPNLAVE